MTAAKRPWSTPQITDMGPRPHDNYYFAEKLASEGIAVFPCKNRPGAPDHRIPRVKWRDGSTTDIKMIDAWWNRWPDALPYIDLSKCGLIVLDGDRHTNGEGRIEHDGVAALYAVLAEHGVDPLSVPTIITPNGGRHLYFRHPAGEPIGSSQGKPRLGKPCKLRPGIDVIGARSAAMAPGAQLSDGRKYTRDKQTPNFYTAWREGEIPVLPDSIAELLRNGHRGDEPITLEPKHASPRSTTSDKRGAAYAERTLDSIAGELSSLRDGRNAATNSAAFRMGTMVGRGWIDRNTVSSALMQVSLANGYVKKRGQKAVRQILESGLDAGEKQPHAELEEREMAIEWKPQRAGKLHGQPAAQNAALESAPASSFTIRGVSWLWKNRFARGKLGLIGGLPDRGKGLITAGMISTVTTGGSWPCEEGTCPQGAVLLLTAEDDPNDTVVPRLIAAGANLDRVHIAAMVRTGDAKRSFSLITDIAMLKAKLEEIGDVSLIIIDPVSAYVGTGKINNYSTTDVRGMLMPLTNLAAETMASIVGIMHFNKKADVTNAMLRIADSLAYVAAARHVYVVVDDTENERRLFVKAKNNLAPDTKALSYSVTTKIVGHDKETGDIWAPYLLWGTEHVNVTMTEAMEAEAAGGSHSSSGAEARDTAKTFLQEMLAAGPVTKRDIDEAAKANCIAQRTLERAKAELGIVAQKGGIKEGWLWQLPEQNARRGSSD